MTFMATLRGLSFSALLATSVAGAALAQGMGGPGDGPMGPGSQMAQDMFKKIDTNGDKSLSPDEIRAYVAGEIKGLDANGDGFLTADEIDAKMTQMMQQRMTMRATSLIDRMGGQDGKIAVDAMAKAPMPWDRIVQRMLDRGDGKISKDAFDRMMTRMTEMRGRMGGHGGPGRHGMRGDGPMGGKGPMTGQPPSGDQAQGAQPPAAGQAGAAPKPFVSFDEIDANHDGFITADEIQAFRLAKVKQMDANGDGFVTADEMTQAMMARAKPRIATRVDAFVKQADLNGDGKLSVEEVAAIPLDMMFFHLPKDQNGAVSEQAFLRAMEHGPMMGPHGGPRDHHGWGRHDGGGHHDGWRDHDRHHHGWRDGGRDHGARDEGGPGMGGFGMGGFGMGWMMDGPGPVAPPAGN